MSRRRKTVSVEIVREMANRILQHSTDKRSQAREGVQVMFEKIALDTGNYAGFGYLNSNDMKKSQNGTTVGINDDGTFEGTDNTRIFYFPGRGR